MQRSAIPFNEFALPPIQAFAERWFLLTAGENRPSQFNLMTIAWGGFGVMWSKPLAMVVVRPTRYTYEFLERSHDFTLCALPAALKDKLTLCGTKSGRSLDKVKASGLTPVVSTVVKAPGYAEAELVVECRKMYYDDLDPQHFLSPDIASNYSGRDYHRMYFGEIVAIHGTADYRCPAKS